MSGKSKTFKRYKRRVRYKVIYFFVNVLIRISNVIPRIVWLKALGFFGGLSYYFARESKRKVQQHLTFAYGDEKSQQEIKKLTKDVFRMIAMNAADVLRAFKIQDLPSYESFRVIHGIEHVEKAFSKGKGLIFLTAHLGAFEFIATEFAFRGYKPFIIGSRVKGKRLNELVTQQRSKLGATAIERGKDTLKLMKNLKAGGTMCILIDQDTRVKSTFVNFFGKPCATPIGATLFALRTGAAVVPTFIHLREDYMQEIVCYPEIEMTITGNEEEDYRINTQKMSDVIEQEIRKYPAQWVWMHERWKTKPGELVD